MPEMQNSLSAYFRGEKLYGDDFSQEEIASWFEDEKEGYADLGAKDAERYGYEYHALNLAHSFSGLPDRDYPKILGYGSAYGHELLPIIDKASAVTIVDPSTAFVHDSLGGKPVKYVSPNSEGTLPFDDSSFDLICCFGVLHHIPNVSAVLSEMGRVMKPDAFLLLREPVVSMGDWTVPRPGLTKRERGIPYPVFRNIALNAGFQIKRETLCDFALTPRLFGILRSDVYNSPAIVVADKWLSKLFAWNLRYHATSALHRFRPSSAAMILTKG